MKPDPIDVKTAPPRRRLLALGLLGAALLPLAGCASRPLRPLNADGSYCFSTGKPGRRKLSCTGAAVPPPEVEAEAKRFEPSAGALTLYVLRRRQGDTLNQVSVSIDGATRVDTIPDSLLRLRLKPGEHHLALEWAGRSVEHRVSGGAGELRFVELVGSVWLWGSDYRWEDGSLQQSAQAAAACRLIADIDLRER